ncbi:hypothetical protein CGLO_13317 [Colletotrichum gloeosporioides Cg-14]|uniref:t-SNARE coiled-coil homology domain-containing protein n=1 Tax=Colletotrichum gloeosporioides (strain Cg-14) TaxID=1237896 RepID=T0L7D9_COLGC|nr:hypothetical protein CGLO_13317 [Colletotrichum gloeosporioides Cg-14]
MTVAIGDEIRESSALAEKMNDTFDSTRLRLRGTMNRMLVMAQRTGVGWKVWLGFFAAVCFLFIYGKLEESGKRDDQTTILVRKSTGNGVFCREVVLDLAWPRVGRD